MAGSLTTVRKAIERGELAPVYYVTGDEDVLKDELIGQIIDAAVDPASRDFNVDLRSANELDGESLFALVETPPMLAERRVAVVRNLEQWRKNSKPWKMLARYLDQPSPTTTLVLVHGADQSVEETIAAKATHVDAARLDGEALQEWLAARAQSTGLEIEPDAAVHLLNAVGGQLAQLTSELDKLAAAVAPGNPVTLADVESMVGIRHGETVIDWVDAVLAKQTPQAISLLDVVLPQSGVTAVSMLMKLGTSLVGARLATSIGERGKNGRQVYQALMDQLRSTRPAGVGPWGIGVNRWIKTAKHWSGPELDRAIACAYDADRLLKSTRLSDERGVLTTMLLSFNPRGESG